MVRKLLSVRLSVCSCCREKLYRGLETVLEGLVTCAEISMSVEESHHHLRWHRMAGDINLDILFFHDFT